MYHACDQDVFSFCLMKYTVLQFCDFYTATMAYWVTILAMGGVPDQAKSLLHMVIYLFVFDRELQSGLSMSFFILLRHAFRQSLILDEETEKSYLG